MAYKKHSKEYERDKAAKYRATHRDQRRAAVYNRWSLFLVHSKRTGWKISITRDEFKFLTSQLCYYCGGRTPNRSYVGIDRLDSSKGYEPGNVVPCCKPCNHMKSDMSVKEWFDRMERIISFSGRSPQQYKSM